MTPLLMLALLLGGPLPGTPELTGTQKPAETVGSMDVTERDSLPGPRGMGSFVRVALDGLPADAAERGAFLEAFRAAFAEEKLATERAGKDGRVKAAAPLHNRFHLLEADAGRGAFQAELALEQWRIAVPVAPAPAGTRAPGGAAAGAPADSVPVRGELRLALRALTPEAVEADLRPPATRLGLAFEPAATRPELMRRAGRATALLLLERLHHLSADLDEGTRLALAPGVAREAAPR